VAAITSFIVRSSRFTVHALLRRKTLETLGRPLTFPLPEGVQRGTANRKLRTANSEPSTVSQVASGGQSLGQAIETPEQLLVFVGVFLIWERSGFLVDLYGSSNEFGEVTRFIVD
jgi:hypothetical protein